MWQWSVQWPWQKRDLRFLHWRIMFTWQNLAISLSLFGVLMFERGTWPQSMQIAYVRSPRVGLFYGLVTQLRTYNSVKQTISKKYGFTLLMYKKRIKVHTYHFYLIMAFVSSAASGWNKSCGLYSHQVPERFRLATALLAFGHGGGLRWSRGLLWTASGPGCGRGLQWKRQLA